MSDTDKEDPMTEPAADKAMDGPVGGVEAEAPQAISAEEAAELKERLLRALADMENLRRRTQREVEDARKFAVTGFARDLLEVADNLGRALASVPPEAREQSEFMKNLVLGVEMTGRSLQSAFEKHRVRRIEPQKGEKFDHNLHQAMFEVPTADQAPGTIAQVIQGGYVIADRLLRPALVGVAKAAPQADAAGGTAEPGARVDTVV
jgi:molecular chaperone GrpE